MPCMHSRSATGRRSPAMTDEHIDEFIHCNRFVDGVFNSAHVPLHFQESPNAFLLHRILNQP